VCFPSSPRGARGALDIVVERRLEAVGLRMHGSTGRARARLRIRVEGAHFIERSFDEAVQANSPRGNLDFTQRLTAAERRTEIWRDRLAARLRERRRGFAKLGRAGTIRY
jgi:hypothetical protein